MNKRIILSTAGILLFFTAFPLKAVPYISPVRFMEIPIADQVMTMDGNDTEGCWSAQQDLNLFFTPGYSGASDFSSWFRVCWDQVYIYLYADITDDYNHSFDPSYAEVWMFDCVELYLDLDTNNHPSTAYDNNTTQLRFNRGLDYPTSPGRAAISDYIYHYGEKAGGDGWVLEVAVPWTAAMPSGSLPEDINHYVSIMGFDVLMADSDNSDGNYSVGNRDTHAAWDADGLDGTEDLAWNTSSVFGIVELLAEPYPPAIPYTEPVNTMDIPARTGRIIFDGVADEESWSDPQDVSLFLTNGYSGASDFDASFRLTWDMTYLYFFADITDDVEHNYSPGLSNSWMFDNIEFFIDLDTVMGTTAYDDNTIQLRFNRGMNVVETPGRAAAEDFIYHWENRSGGDGWIVETAIPWTCVMPAGYLPEDIDIWINNRMGLDVNFADSDNSDGNATVGNRDVQAAWDEDGLDGTEDLAWNNTHVFGIVDLIGTPSGPEPEIFGLPLIEPVRDMDVPVMNREFIADGDDTESFWSWPQQLTIFNSTDYSGAGDLSAWFRTAWDPEFLYLYASITDDTDQSWSSGLSDAGNYDNLEVYIDLDTFSLETGYRDNSTVMLRFNRGVDFVQTTGRAEDADYRYTIQNRPDGDGWEVEAAIPWTAALALGANPNTIEDYLPVIGFEVLVNDLDAASPTGREYITQAAWDTEEVEEGEAPLEDEAQTNTRVFGIANLSPYGLDWLDSPDEQSVRMYPNPAFNELFLTGDANIKRMRVIHINGQIIMEMNDPNTDRIDMSGLPAGCYIVHYLFNDDRQGSELIVKH